MRLVVCVYLCMIVCVYVHDLFWAGNENVNFAVYLK